MGLVHLMEVEFFAKLVVVRDEDKIISIGVVAMAAVSLNNKIFSCPQQTIATDTRPL